LGGDIVSILSTLQLIPLVGAFAIYLLPSTSPKLVKQGALALSLVTAAVSFWATYRFKFGQSGMQFVESHNWVSGFFVHYAVGADGMSMLLILMTTILAPIVILAGWNEGENGRFSLKTFYFLLLILEAFCISIFSATDLFLFYVVFEVMLLPVYFLIGGYGRGDRAHAAMKFLIFGLVGGLVMLSGMIGLFFEALKQNSPTFDIATLSTIHMNSGVENLLFLAFFFAFAVKAPLWPFHTWLPTAAKSATPGTSIMLLGILDKIGTYGMLRICIAIFPHAAHTFTMAIIVLALISLLYGAMIAINQREIPSLVAWTSISHFGFIIIGIFAMTSQGVSGATFYMFNHAFSTAALFMVGGWLASRRGSHKIDDFGGVQRVAPVAAWMMFIAGLSGLALPGLSSFVSEFLVMLGTFSRHPVVGIIATFAIVLAALYILLMVQRALHGATAAGVEGMSDLNIREKIAIAPVIAVLIFLGFYPKPALHLIAPSTSTTLTQAGVSDPAPISGNFSTTEAGK
jgi:NADH-quinone oxidoreductase subunit M